MNLEAIKSLEHLDPELGLRSMDEHQLALFAPGEDEPFITQLGYGPLFAGMLDYEIHRRLNERRWIFLLSNATWPNSDTPALAGGFTAFIYPSELMEGEPFEGIGNTLEEALLSAYLKAVGYKPPVVPLDLSF